MKRALLLALTAALLLAAPVAASWGPRQRLSAGGGDGGEDVALAGNARGDAIAAWHDRRGIRVAFARRGKRFGKPRYAPGARRGVDPSVTIDAQGNALVLWSYFDNTSPADPEERDEGCCLGTRMTVRSAATGTMRRAQSLTPKGHEVGVVAASIDRGRVGLAWDQDFDSRVYARFASRGHPLGRTLHVTRGDTALGVAFLRQGPAVTYAATGSNRFPVREFRVRRGRIGHVRTLATGVPADAGFELATNRRGQQAFAWSNAGAVHAGVRSASGRFRMRRISHVGAPLGPSVAIAPSGAAIVAWNTFRGEIFVAGRRAGAALGNARPFGARRRGATISDLQIAVDSFGRAVLGWLQQSPGGRSRARGAFRTIGGQERLPRVLGAATALGAQGTAALDAHRRARLIWRNGGTVNVVRAAGPR